MPKTKDKDKIEVVAVNPTGITDPDGNALDEVFLYREGDAEGNGYVNEAKYVKAGTYKLGAFTEATIEKKEEV